MAAAAPQRQVDHAAVVQELEQKADESTREVTTKADEVLESARRLRRRLTPPPLRAVSDPKR